MQNGLRIATEIGHREWLVGNRFALGVLYVELFEPDKTRQQLEQALILAKGLRSQYWIHHVIGALAAAYDLHDDLDSAQTCLETEITPQTSMDTMGKRYCWARRAELALYQGEPGEALEIVERLIASALGLSHGGVITFLWKLKGEALAALGSVEEAASLLNAAIENARVLEERFLLWRLHACLGRVYGAINDQEEARKEYASARELIQELASTVPDEALKENFLQGAYRVLEPE